jgi:hypothetical protein
MRGLAIALGVTLVLIFLLQPFATGAGASAASTASISVSPTAGIVGSRISVDGVGYPPNTSLTLEWGTAKASWVVTENPPRVTGVNATPIEETLTTAVTNSSGSFAVTVPVPSDYGGQHVIQALLSNGTVIGGRGLFNIEPSFTVSPASGPADTPIRISATGLGYGLYSTNYFLYYDNTQTGYFTAVTTGGATNFTIYASGTPGTHYIEIYQGYPGPGYLNPWDSPASLERQSLYPPYIPFHTQFEVTGDPSQASLTVPSLTVLAAALASAGLVVALTKAGPERRGKFAVGLAVTLIVVAVVAAGAGAYFALAPSAAAPVAFTPQATVVRPTITVAQNTVTSGPRITVTPDLATVGQNITVNGAGFAPGASLALSLSSRKGDNILGFKLVNNPLRNVTASASGTFSFTMAAPPALGGIHYISAGNLTTDSNGTLFVQRTAAINATEGPAGSTVAVTLKGVGWTFDANLATLDYDNSYIGYACGFNSGGNVTFLLTVDGAPGVHTIDVYPSIWWGPSNQADQLAAEYRFSLLTPQDHPELMPSFHFTFLITSSGQQGQDVAYTTPSLGLSLVALVTSLTPATFQPRRVEN